MESWKVNLISVWFGCFFTGLAISQILPFLPLYVSQLSVNLCRAICKALERTLDELFWEERPLLRLTACNARPTPPHEWVKKEAKG